MCMYLQDWLGLTDYAGLKKILSLDYIIIQTEMKKLWRFQVSTQERVKQTFPEWQNTEQTLEVFIYHTGVMLTLCSDLCIFHLVKGAHKNASACSWPAE